MMRFPRIAVFGCILVLAAVAPAQELIYCPASPTSSGDRIDRGMYVPSFPGSSLGAVILSYSCRGSGEVTFELTAREGAFDGPVIGVAQATVITSGGQASIASARFNFRGAPVTEGSTLTFSQKHLSGLEDVICFYNTGTDQGELCEGMVIETEGTQAPLSVDRRNGMGITIFPGVGSVPSTYWVAVVSHADGAEGSVWRSALSLLNRSVETADVTLRLHVDGVQERSLAIDPGAGVIVEDVVDWVESGLTGSGALEVVSNQALVVGARTANTISDEAACFPGGTFGQVFEGHTVHSGLVTDEIVRVSSLRETSSARTNIGFTNTGSTAAQVSYTLFDADGLEVYSSQIMTIGAGRWRQENRPYFVRAGLDEVDGGWATVKIHRGVGLQVYASVIDALTGDAATIWAVH